MARNQLLALGFVVAGVFCAALFTGSPLTNAFAATGVGRESFEKRCGGCHALDAIKAGPALRGIYLRKAASTPAFPYSDALKKSQITWDAAALDRWLANPDEAVPGNDMSIRLENANERAAIISFLRELSAK